MQANQAIANYLVIDDNSVSMGVNINHTSRRSVLRSALAAGALGTVGTATVAGDVTVEVNVGYDRPSGRRAARAEASEVVREFAFDALTIRTSRQGADRLLNRGDIRYVEENGLMYALDHTVGEDDGDPTEEQVLPWGIDRVDADVAHHDGETGAGSGIAIIDTGIDPNHETLVVTGGEAFVSCRGPCAEDWGDDHGHGTHCAGTADAVDNDIGVVGVATEADLYAVKVLDNSGSGTWSDVAAGIEWTADEGIDVGSLSLGGGHSETVQDACEYAYEKGTLLVAAAGNSGPDEDTVGYPAAYEECIAVSATNENDDIASFSSRGEEVELAAPGVDVLSSLPGDDYDHWDGTSMACPHVAGAGAQLMEHDYSNEEARGRLNETAEDIGLADTAQGNGLVDVAAALGIDDDDEDDPDEESLSVETRDASDVDESSATLNGELTELEGHDEVTVYFEWGESGEGLTNTTEEQTLDSTGEFDDEVTDLDSGTVYEYRAVAEAGDDSDTGDTLPFTTESDDDDNDDDEETTAPVIDEFVLTDRSNPRWARVRVDWAVSDDDGNLDTVESVLELDGDEKDSEKSSVSGSDAEGEHDLRERDGHDETYDVTLTVTDTDGNKTSQTQQIDL